MKQRMVSGIQPSGNLHIGNYLGAIRQWVDLQNEYDLFLFVADLHAITTPQNPDDLRQRTIEIAKLYLAAGIDPTKTTIFVQSHIPEHTQLGWVLNTIARIGDLEKMTQFKDKTNSSFNFNVYKKNIQILEESIVKEFIVENKQSWDKNEIVALLKDFRIGIEKPLTEALMEQRNKETVGVGLFDYPVLMAGDILMYDAEKVPVGDDQVQHVELTRTLARRFNKRFGEMFIVPQSLVQKEGARIMALDNPSKKMSKSASSEYSYISLLDTPEQARKKIMKAVTDSGSQIMYSDEKPALKNLINIYALLGNTTVEKVTNQFLSKQYSEFKQSLADVVSDFLVDFQAKYTSFSDEAVRDILAVGAKRAQPIAQAKLAEVYRLIGLR